MKFLFVCTFALVAYALPLSELRSDPYVARRKAPYSVVPVDGGQPDGAAPPKTEIVTKDSTQTVTEPPKTLPPVTETVLSTTIVTESEIATTVITTLTSTSTPLTTEIPAPEGPHSTSMTLATVTNLVSTVDTVVITTTPTPTSTPYDNGMWHTTYYKAAEPSSSSDTSSAAANETPSPMNDAESATFTGIPLNGTYAMMLRGKNKPKPSNIFTTDTTTRSSTTAAIKTKPPMPTLPTTSEVLSPSGIPSTDLSKHMVPGFGR
jgi:hypothetical protein